MCSTCALYGVSVRKMGSGKVCKVCKDDAMKYGMHTVPSFPTQCLALQNTLHCMQLEHDGACSVPVQCACRTPPPPRPIPHTRVLPPLSQLTSHAAALPSPCLTLTHRPHHPMQRLA